MALYTDKDVSAILKRASELQARTQGTASTGLTLEELQTIAREVGVDPQFVAQAAREAAHAAPPDTTAYFWGGPMRVQADRTVPGAVTEDVWEAVVREARRTFGQTGKTDEVGRTREWRHDVLTTTMGLVSASPKQGEVALHAERRMDSEAVLAYLLPLMMAFTGGLLASLLMGVPGLLISLVAFVLVFFGCRALYGRLTRSARRKLDEMLARVEQTATFAATPLATAQATPAPRLTLPDEAPPEADAAEGTRLRAS